MDAIMKILKVQADRQIVADIQAGASAFLAGTTWIADLEIFMQLTATAVAIVAGIAAAWFHVERAINMRKEREANKED